MPFYAFKDFFISMCGVCVWVCCEIILIAECVKALDICKEWLNVL